MWRHCGMLNAQYCSSTQSLCSFLNTWLLEKMHAVVELARGLGCCWNRFNRTDSIAMMLLSSLFLVFTTVLMHSTYAGFRPESFDKLICLLDLKYPSWDSTGISILEFGDQLFYGDYPDCYSPFSRRNISIDIARNHLPAKLYFQQIPGVTHTSVDINGNNGAIALDVRKPMSDALTGRYDVITNYGFTEHVGEGEAESELLRNQYLAFKNMHDVASIGTLMIHYVPPLNFWYAHGVCGYENSFFEGLVAANGYGSMLAPMLYESSTFTAFVKQADTPFISLEAFSHLSGLMSKYPHYRTKKISVARTSGQLLEQTVDFSVTDQVLFAAELCSAEFSSVSSPEGVSDCVESAIKALSYAGVYTTTISAPGASTITVQPVHQQSHIGTVA